MAVLDDINTALRDFTRYTGDGLPNPPVGHPPPVGDPTTGVHNISKATLRSLLTTVAQTMGDPSALQDILSEVQGKADIALVSDLTTEITDTAASVAYLRNDLGDPVSGPNDRWVTIDLDQSGRFVRGTDIDGWDHRAKAGAILAEEVPGLDLAAWLPWDDVTLDASGRVKRALHRNGVIYEARGGVLLPISNTGLLRSAVAYGDSTTFGDELDEDVPVGTVWQTARWTALLGSSLGIDIENRGINGQTSEQIAARMSALPTRATVNGGVIAASGSTTLNDLTIDLHVGGPAWNNRSVELVADDGSRVRGLLIRTNSTTYSFTRYEPGAAVAATSVDIYCYKGWCDLAQHVLIGMGINDEPLVAGGTLTVAQVQDFYRAATTSCRGGFTVWGLLDRGVSEAAGTPNGDFIRAMEVWLTSQYGADYCPVRAYLASARALEDAVRLVPAYTPSADDTAAVQVNSTPPSFRSGGVHLSPLGHRLMALCLERHLRKRFHI